MHYFLSREVLAADKMEPDLYCKGSQIVAPSICGSLVWNLLYVTLLVPRILRWFLDFLKIYIPLLFCICNITVNQI